MPSFLPGNVEALHKRQSAYKKEFCDKSSAESLSHYSMVADGSLWRVGRRGGFHHNMAVWNCFSIFAHIHRLCPGVRACPALSCCTRWHLLGSGEDGERGYPNEPTWQTRLAVSIPLHSIPLNNPLPHMSTSQHSMTNCSSKNLELKHYAETGGSPDDFFSTRCRCTMPMACSSYLISALCFP